MIDPFVHLHVHTDYSILDGHTTLSELAEEVSALRQPAVAITDHGSMGGVRKFWKSCNDAGIKPIIGMEAYVAPQSRFEKSPVFWGKPQQRSDDVSGSGSYTHLTVIATTDEGLCNLFRLHATSYADGFYRKPRIDIDAVAEFNRGLVVTTGCAGGELATRIRLDQLNEARDYLSKLKDIFDDRLYVEVMEHDNPIDDVINPHLIRLSKEFDVPLVATNDSHYTKHSDAYSHDALLCLSTGQKLNGIRKFKFEGTGYHLKSHQEMEEVFRELPSAISATLKIAERVEGYGKVFSDSLRMPVFPDRNEEDATAYLQRTILEKKEWSEEERRQLNYEIEVIGGLNFSDYHLVVADVVNWARTQGIRVGPGRGSAGGSLVAHALGITTLHPQKHNLLFERYLNPERVSLPDVDVDIQGDRRDEVLNYIIEKYGEEHVAQIGTYGSIGAKSALHDAARVLGKPRSLSDRLTFKLPSPAFGRQPSLREGSWNGLDSEQIEVLTLAKSLEGKTRSPGIHAAGVVISSETLKTVLPLWKQTGKGRFVTAFDMEDVEHQGLVKIDFLGLKNLSIIDDCMNYLVDIPWDINILATEPTELVDPKTYQLLSSGNTLGVFQMDSPGMQQLLKSVKPDKFDDIAAIIALYRPGPMGVNAHHGYAKRKNKKESVSYPHPELAEPLKDVLGPTYGFVVYQEQVLEILRICCGYTYATADGIFNAMRKKLTEKMLAAKPDFSSRMLANGYSNECVEALWAVLLPFSDYSFGRAHSKGYGVTSYWTAYLKANHPIEYMAALLSAEEDPKKLPQYVAEVERMKITILPPDINLSNETWTPAEDGIRYGLKSIKGFGEKAFGTLLKKRPFRSLHDFFNRADATSLNKKTLGVLIRSGALDTLCPQRSTLYAASEGLAQRALSDRRLRRSGEIPLLGATKYEIDSSSTDDFNVRREWEQELLGTVLSEAPVTLTAKKWLTEEEFYLIKTVVDNNPGKTQLKLTLGYATIHVGYINWNDRTRTVLEAVL